MQTPSTPLKVNNNDILRYSLYENPNASLEEIHWNFIPLPYSKFITICVDSSYKYWADVIELVLPIVYAEKIGIICFSSEGRANYKNCQNFNYINIRGAAYLLKRTLSHFCGQDWSLTLGQNNGIGSYTFLETGKKEDLFIREYSGSINELERPELVAQEIFNKLNIKKIISTETKLIGDSYGEEMVEMIPDFELTQRPNVSENTLIGIRCDLVENWDFVFQAISLGMSPMVISNTLPTLPMASFLTGVSCINLLVNENTRSEDVDRIVSLGINCNLLSDGESENKVKRNLFEYKINSLDSWGSKNLDKLKLLNYDTSIRSKRTLVSKDGNFLSTYHWRLGLSSKEKKGNMLLDGPQDSEFLREADLIYYFN